MPPTDELQLGTKHPNPSCKWEWNDPGCKEQLRTNCIWQPAQNNDCCYPDHTKDNSELKLGVGKYCACRENGNITGQPTLNADDQGTCAPSQFLIHCDGKLEKTSNGFYCAEWEKGYCWHGSGAKDNWSFIKELFTNKMCGDAASKFGKEFFWQKDEGNGMMGLCELRRLKCNPSDSVLKVCDDEALAESCLPRI